MRAGVCALWTLALLGAAAPLAVTAPAWLDARAHARREFALVRDAVRDARLIAELRVALPPHAEHDATPLARRVGAVLAAAGLPAGALSDLSPESSLRSAGVVGRRTTLTLTGVTLPELGRFLAAWREAEPAWTVTAADLTPESSRTTQPGGDRPLRAVLTLETIFAEVQR